MNILIVDDSSEKISQILSVIKDCYSGSLTVETSLNSLSAQNILKDSLFDLMVVDLCLPIRSGTEPKENGGALLVKEIERKKSLLSPKYIVGISQYEEYLEYFPEIWTTLSFGNSKEWKEKLSRLIGHIEKSNVDTKTLIPEPKPTLIVEGNTDKDIIIEALEVFFPEESNSIKVKSDSNAGAIWVSNQVVALAHSMSGGTNSKQKIIGLLDGDKAGRDAKEEIDRIISTNSAMRSYFKIMMLSADYARNMIPLYSKGLCLPISIEELFAPSVWKHAEEKNWLEIRNSNVFTSLDLKDWNKMKQGFEDYIETLDLSDDNMLYLNKVKTYNKKDLVKHVVSLNNPQKKDALENFEPLIKDIIDYLV